MTNNDEGSKLEAMGEPLIELTAPDGTVMRFRFGAVIPLDDIEYAVLLEMEDNPDGEEQVLVTRIEPTDDGGGRHVHGVLPRGADARAAAGNVHGTRCGGIGHQRDTPRCGAVDSEGGGSGCDAAQGLTLPLKMYFILFPDSPAPSACAFSLLASAHST